MSHQLYARIFTQILDSSLAEDWQARHVFEDLLKLADGGMLDMTRQSIARRTNVPLGVINKALDVLEAPDPASRDATEDGRRIVRLDAHRDWGWRIVNWDKYEAIRSKEDQRLKTAERVRRHRAEKKAVSSALLPKEETDSDSDSDSDSEDALRKRYPPLHTVTPQANESNKRPAKAGPTSDNEWLQLLASDKTYEGIDVKREYGKMLRWCEQNNKQATRRRFVNWLNRADQPVSGSSNANHNGKPKHVPESNQRQENIKVPILKL